MLAALEAGVTSFESSFGELGCCPVPAGATGNIATEDLVSMLHEMGVQTGINLCRLLTASRDAQAVLGEHSARGPHSRTDRLAPPPTLISPPASNRRAAPPTLERSREPPTRRALATPFTVGAMLRAGESRRRLHSRSRVAPECVRAQNTTRKADTDESVDRTSRMEPTANRPGPVIPRRQRLLGRTPCVDVDYVVPQ